MLHNRLMLVAAVGAVIGGVAPAAGQGAPPPPPQPMMLRDGPAGTGLGTLRMGLADLSPEGRATVQEAVRAARDPEALAAIRVARARILQLMAAERLDVAAFERALREERTLAMRQQERAHSTLLATVQKLSPADRKALADAGLRARERLASRRAVIIERARSRQPGPPPAMDGTMAPPAP